MRERQSPPPDRGLPSKGDPRRGRVKSLKRRRSELMVSVLWQSAVRPASFFSPTSSSATGRDKYKRPVSYRGPESETQRGRQRSRSRAAGESQGPLRSPP